MPRSATVEAHPPTHTAAHPRRDPWLDNARFGLIALVVFGHLLEPLLTRHPVLAASYDAIYAFHMPAFAFLSGAVSVAHLDRRLVRSVLFRLLLPYVAFQGLYALAAQWQAWPDDGPHGITVPYWLLWYLTSLACWRLLLPLFAKLRAPVWIAVAVALLAGCSNSIGYELSLSRTVVFFPAFLLGWQYADRWRHIDEQPRARWLAASALLALFGAAWLSKLYDDGNACESARFNVCIHQYRFHHRTWNRWNARDDRLARTVLFSGSSWSRCGDFIDFIIERARATKSRNRRIRPYGKYEWIQKDFHSDVLYRFLSYRRVIFRFSCF